MQNWTLLSSINIPQYHPAIPQTPGPPGCCPAGPIQGNHSEAVNSTIPYTCTSRTTASPLSDVSWEKGLIKVVPIVLPLFGKHWQRWELQPDSAKKNYENQLKSLILIHHLCSCFFVPVPIVWLLKGVDKFRNQIYESSPLAR